ncbi:MAG: hypothetical protein A2V93_00365 [Ignavibacteria bacterium RBG_16_34_14]|nr:MAG: hypothetical protein A2V93_00365 [Ignavibacteria bacterium RBG_16_34_14]
MYVPKFYNMNSYHHLYNRGVNKGTIFFDDNDYKYFLRKMKEYKEKYSVRINCFCLLPNHFHFFTKQLTNDHTIGKFVGDLTNAYTRRTNKKYDRIGVLFEGKTKSKLISDESYFIWLCKYILNNPVKAGLVNQPEEWEYSSAKEYFNPFIMNLTNTKEILSRFKSIDEFKSFIKIEEVRFSYSLLF